MGEQGIPEQVLEAIKDSVDDCNIYFFDAKVETSTKYLILIGTVFVVLCGYIVLNLLAGKSRKRKREGQFVNNMTAKQNSGFGCRKRRELSFEDEL